MIRRIRKTVFKRNLPSINRYFLNLATDLNNPELLALLLTDGKCDLNSSVRCGALLRPLIFAIKKKNQAIVQILLDAGSSVTSPSTNTLRLLNMPWEDNMSAIEYACIKNQPEILKLLVSRDKRQNPERYV